MGAPGVDPARSWVANTDADTVVPPHWLTAQVALAGDGHALVVGTVLPDPRDLTGRRARAVARAAQRWATGTSTSTGPTSASRWPPTARSAGSRHLPVHEDVELVGRCAAPASPGSPPAVSRRRPPGVAWPAPRDGFAGYLDGLGA